ncbi:hypothetical protein CA598_31470 [Paenibacillus sp. VTT E-133291]|nr:hypothetical protein CA598_31470 [Paenibacillus sp. VTT E-133291]
MVTLLYGPVEKSLLPTGGGGLKPPKGLDSVKDFEVQKPLPSFSTNEGFQFKINNLDVDTPALPQTPVQINFKNEMDRILREKLEGKSDSNHSIKDVEVKAVEGAGKGADVTKGYDVTPKYSSYKERLDRTPKNNGTWEAERGESKFVSEKPEVKEYLDEAGVDGVEYKNAIPNFSLLPRARLKSLI